MDGRKQVDDLLDRAREAVRQGAVAALHLYYSSYLERSPGHGKVFVEYLEAARKVQRQATWKDIGETGMFGRILRPQRSEKVWKGCLERLRANPFDLDALEVMGPGVLLVENVAWDPSTGGVFYDVSDNGTLVYVAGGPQRAETELQWLDREGNTFPATRQPRQYNDVALSPDGRRMVVLLPAADNKLWMLDMERDLLSRLTYGPGNDHLPIWSPDGRRIVFRSDRDGGVPKLYVAGADGTGGARQLVDQPLQRGMTIGRPAPHRWSPDGKLIAYAAPGDAGPELWTVRPDGSEARKRIDDVSEFDWYPDSRHGLITRRRGSEKELIAVDLESGREQLLYVGALREIDIAPDGSAVAFCYGRGHFSMGLAWLPLTAPAALTGLSAAMCCGFTRPKSSTFTKASSAPIRHRKMFAGLMSRWTSPRSCASTRERATCSSTCARNCRTRWRAASLPS